MPRFEDGSHPSQIHCSLPRTRDSMQQHGGEFFVFHSLAQNGERSLLFFVEVELERSRSRLRPRDSKIGGFVDKIDETPPHKSAQRSSWDPKRSQSFNRNLAPRGREGIDNRLLIRIQLAIGRLQFS